MIIINYASSLKRIIFIVALMIATVSIISGEVASAASLPTSEAQIITWLKELRPLKKVHYSWSVRVDTISDDLLYEYMRLTHAISLTGEDTNSQERIDRLVQLCKRINGTNPTIPASIAVNYDVWHRFFGATLPPTDTGATAAREMYVLTTRFKDLKTKIANANAKYGSNIAVTAILYDEERFTRSKTDLIWNNAITQKRNAAYDTSQVHFPKSRVVWFNRGWVGQQDGGIGWVIPTPPVTGALKEKGYGFSTCLYRILELADTREGFRRTLANAVLNGESKVTPWVALAAGYQRQPEIFEKWTNDWNYNLIYSWQLGAEINLDGYSDTEIHRTRFAPWNAAEIAIFYPDPFRISTPHWGEHFVAYARGANGIRKLPEVAVE